ncbi:MAG: M28 family peptidase [Longimicrobiales bacterium]
MFTARTTARTLAPVLLVATALAAGSTTLHAQKAKLNQYGYPEKLKPKATTAAITPAELMTRLYIFADDSMMGRDAGRVGNTKGTDYLARELKRLGIEPAGDNGTYFQTLPGVGLYSITPSTFSVDGRVLMWATDYVIAPNQIAASSLSGAEVIYGGVMGDTLNELKPGQAAGKIVVVRPAAAGAGRAGGARAGQPPRPNPLAGALGVVNVNLDGVAADAIERMTKPANREVATVRGVPQTNIVMRVTTAGATTIFGKPLTDVPVGTVAGKANAQINYVFEPRPEWARNVVGIIRGSDPKLRGQYVAIGAHNDHVGFGAKVDHDSAFAMRHARMKMTIRNQDTIRALTPEEVASIKINVDSLHKIRPARIDSINNGADDDGSGSMAVLEIAEAFSKAAVKPKRSILFVWHTGEEDGLVGSAYYATHTTVPKDSIVAQINIDMIGRGRAEDLPGGGPDYLGVVGRNMLSAELGTMVESVNKKQRSPLRLDDRYDQNVTSTLGGSYNNIYGRSDHYNYALQGIPIAFFFTGLHGDYHQTTDEPQYIDYPHYARITNYIRDLIVEIGNNPKRPALTKPVS